MKQKLIELLSIICPEVYLQGSMNPDEQYPDDFFTYWVFEANENSHYNNSPISCDWGFWIYFYSTNPKKVEDYSLEAKNLLKNNGFVFIGKPIDAKSDVSTHTGCILTCYFKEVYTNA